MVIDIAHDLNCACAMVYVSIKDQSDHFDLASWPWCEDDPVSRDRLSHASQNFDNAIPGLIDDQMLQSIWRATA